MRGRMWKSTGRKKLLQRLFSGENSSTRARPPGLAPVHRGQRLFLVRDVAQTERDRDQIEGVVGEGGTSASTCA